MRWILVLSLLLEVVDTRPPVQFPKFTHLKMIVHDPDGFVIQIEDHPERVPVYRGHGEALSPKYKQLPALAARTNPSNYIVHVYDEHNRLCRVFAIPRCDPSYTYKFWSDGHMYQVTAWTFDDYIEEESDDPNFWPDLSHRQVNNFHLWSYEP